MGPARHWHFTSHMPPWPLLCEGPLSHFSHQASGFTLLSLLFRQGAWGSETLSDLPSCIAGKWQKNEHNECSAYL